MQSRTGLWTCQCGIEDKFEKIMNGYANRPTDGPNWDVSQYSFFVGDSPVQASESLGQRTSGQAGILIVLASSPMDVCLGRVSEKLREKMHAVAPPVSRELFHEFLEESTKKTFPRSKSFFSPTAERTRKKLFLTGNVFFQCVKSKTFGAVQVWGEFLSGVLIDFFWCESGP